ncbi:DUF6000 family protein [Streptomyces sp. NPDC004126]|uniref:DUF6000 family protein n=1 Tax=Streptomyces sp. NPDC004126 TaxID=3390695 RepID=UPI003D069B8A
MPIHQPQDAEYRRVIDRYMLAMDSGHPRYLELGNWRVLRPQWPHRERFARGLIADAASIPDADLETLLERGWRPRVTAAWLIGVGLRTAFRERIGTLLLDSEVCYAGSGYCFALARFGTAEDAGILTAYLDRYLPQTGLDYDQGAALGALLHLDARLGTDHAGRFTRPDGPWDRWARARGPAYAPGADDVRGEMRRWISSWCDFANGWTHP